MGDIDNKSIDFPGWTQEDGRKAVRRSCGNAAANTLSPGLPRADPAPPSRAPMRFCAKRSTTTAKKSSASRLTKLHVCHFRYCSDNYHYPFYHVNALESYDSRALTIYLTYNQAYGLNRKAIYLTTSTEQGASSITLLATEPKNNRCKGFRPRWPIAMRSYFPPSAISTICGCAAPTITFLSV